MGFGLSLEAWMVCKPTFETKCCAQFQSQNVRLDFDLEAKISVTADLKTTILVLVSRIWFRF